MKKINIAKELKDNQTVLMLTTGDKYNDAVLEVTKQLANNTLCYVTLNKTHHSLEDTFKKKKISTKNMIFIDAISKSIREMDDQSKNGFFVSSPAALTELSIIISKFLKHEFEYLIFDSISTMSAYQNKNIIVRFITNLANKIKESETKSVFFALDSKEQEDLNKQCGTIVDKVVEIK